jgi:hypothetical protein
MLLVALVGCLLDPSGMGGEENDGVFDTGVVGDPGSDAADVIEVKRWFASGSADSVGEPHALTLSDDGDRGIAVEHVGFEAPCTAAVDGSASREGTRIVVTYSVAAPDTYSDTCAWTLQYTLANVGEGVWIVEAAGDTGTVTIGARR